MSAISIPPALRTWRRYCWLLGLGLLTLISLGAYGLVVRPVQNAVVENRRQIGKLNQFALCAQAIETRHGAVTQKYTEMKHEYDAQLRRFPPAAAVAEFLAWTSEHARELGMELRDFRPAGSTKYGEYDGMTIRIHGVGSYATLGNFLHELTSGPRATRVVSIEIVPLDNDREQFQITLQLMVFFQPAKTPVANPGEQKHV